MDQNKNLPDEYVPVVSMIQKEESIRKGIEAMKKKILVSAGDEFQSWPEEKQNQFFERTIISIAKDEKLISCFESPEGKLSIIEAVEKAVSTGLMIGGKHAYLVPQPKKTNRRDEKGQNIWVTEIRFSIRDRGYYALLCGGKKPIFLDLRWGVVRKKEAEQGLVEVDKASGEVKHKQYLGDDAGPLVGCWVQAKKINQQLEVEYYHVSKIEQWRNSSKAYQSAVKQKYNDSPWLQWPEEMALQACIRHFCERYEEARELLASALYDDENIQTEEKTTVENIDEALSKPEPGEEQTETEKRPENEKKPEQKQDDNDLDLF